MGKKQRSESQEITITRVYEAPVAAVWDAWTDVKQVAQWWGPRGFTITTHSKDLRPGGRWVYTMHGPDGTDYPNDTLYHEVVKHERLVYDHGASGDRPPLFRVTVLFSEQRGKTTMQMTMRCASVQAATETKKFIKSANGDSTWDRLGEYLVHTATKQELFIINRSFDVSIERMFEVWTDPKHIARWLAPKGFEMQYLTADIRTGGSSTYMMTDGVMRMYGRATYHEISRPNRLVYEQIFTDEKGNLSRHPRAPTWPEAMVTTVTFTAEDEDRTRVTVQWEPRGTAEEIATFVQARAGMMGGWTGSFDKLEDYLEASDNAASHSAQRATTADSARP